MKNILKSLSLLVIIFLSACGGRVDGVVVGRTPDGKLFRCLSQSDVDICRAGSCSQCICFDGCSSSAPQAKLAVTMSPATLAVDEPGDLRLRLSSAAASSQTVSFTLRYPQGGVSQSAVAFSSPCTTPTLSVGAQSIVAVVVVPANTASCTFELRKQFSAAANPVSFELTNLSLVELEGALPNVTVVPSFVVVQ
jgi:hypothetical protein